MKQGTFKGFRVEHHDEGMKVIFFNSRTARRYGTLGVYLGVVGLVGALVAENPYAIVLAIVGAGVLIAAIGVLRSRVIVDQVGMHVRRTVGWREMQWSSVLGFLVEKTTTRAGTMYSVVVFRSRGRSIRPTALAGETQVDAESTVRLLDKLRLSGRRG